MTAHTHTHTHTHTRAHTHTHTHTHTRAMGCSMTDSPRPPRLTAGQHIQILFFLNVNCFVLGVMNPANSSHWLTALIGEQLSLANSSHWPNSLFLKPCLED